MKLIRCLTRTQNLLRGGACAAACLVLIACGAADTTSAEAAAGDVLPTAVPTTPPLFLPPADDSLPALAALPATGGLAEPLTNSEPDPTDTTTAPAAASAMATASTTADAEQLSIASGAMWGECMVNAARATNAVALLDPIAAGSTTDMSSVQLNSLAAASVGCDVVATNLSDTDLGDHLATASTCLNAWLESSAGGSVLVGLTSIGSAQPTPTWAQPQLVDALDACLTGASFAADVMVVVSADPALTGAFNADCLAASFDTSGTLRAFAQALATDPSSAALYVGLGDAWVLSCANVGQVVAAAAAADGVALSTSTIACIDSELKSSGMVVQLIAGTADTTAVGVATIACLTDTEATALLG